MNKKITLSLALLSIITSASAQSVGGPYNDVERAIKYNQYDVAKKDLYRLVRSQPNFGRAYYFLGMVHLNEKNLDSAQYYFKQGLRAPKDANVNNLGLGRLLLLEGKDKEAKSKFNSGTQDLAIGDYQTYIDIAHDYMYAPKPDYDMAYLFVGSSLLVNNEVAEPHVARGDIYFAEKRFVDARRVYYEASKLFPQSILPKMKLAAVLRAGNEFEDAVKAYEEIVALDPTYVDVYKQLGLAYADYARFKDDRSLLAKGVENYFKYHGMIGESMSSDDELAAYLIKNKEYKGLSDLVRTKWYTRGDNFKMYRYGAIADFQNGKFAEAKQSIDMYFDVQDNKEEILPIDYLYKGLAELETSRDKEGKFDEKVYKKSIDEMAKAVQNNPKLGVALHELGMDLFKDEHYDQSYFVFDLASKDEKSPYYVYDMYYKGNSLYLASDKPMFNDQLQKAKSDLDVSMKKTPTFEAALISARVNRNINSSTSLAEMEKDYESFITLLNQKGRSNDAAFRDALVEAYTQVANYNKTKNKSKAVEYYQKALNLDSSNDFVKRQVESLK